MNETQVLVRSLELELDADGRTFYGRCVPYDHVATVGPDAWSPDRPYQESFAPGAFKRAHDNPRHVLLNFEHREGLMDQAGNGLRFEDHSDGLYGWFRAGEGPVGDQALSLYRAGALGHFSVGFSPIGRGRRRDGVVVRTRCHLDHVALCRSAAYPGTEIAVRAATFHIERPPVNEALERRLVALGFDRNL